MDRIIKLISQLGGGNHGERRDAAQELGEIGDARAIEPLSRALTDEDNSVRETAVKALGELGDTEAIGPLLHALTDEHYFVRGEAVNALAMIGDARAVEPLQQMLTDDSFYVRSAAAGALGMIGDIRVVEPLLLALADENFFVRKAAALALGGIGRQEAMPALRARLRRIGGERDKIILSEIRTAVIKIEQATAKTARLPRAAEPEAPSATGLPRAGEDGPAPNDQPR